VRQEDVTVIVPTRNEKRNIQSFLASLPPTVVLVVVDSSDDDTADLVETIRPERTLVIRQSCNVTQARQLGARVARTPWLLFTDADVVFTKDYFHNLLHYENYDVLYGPKLSDGSYTRYYLCFQRGQALFHRIGIPAASGSNLLIRIEVFSQVGGFDLELSCNEDSEIAWRIKRQGYRVGFGRDLRVIATDHRRLQRGVARKTFHSLARCTLLYLNILPRCWRINDWGYWSARSENLNIIDIPSDHE
jgi:glycosyltransferase involved in cell wall biosynthesis